MKVSCRIVTHEPLGQNLDNGLSNPPYQGFVLTPTSERVALLRARCARPTGCQSHKKPTKSPETLNCLTPKSQTKSGEGAAGARAAEGAAGARGENVINCAGEALPGLRVCIFGKVDIFKNRTHFWSKAEKFKNRTHFSEKSSLVRNSTPRIVQKNTRESPEHSS